jgi:chromosome segregation ATPase
MSPVAHLAKALAELAQDFADKSATQKVMELLNTLFQNLMQSRADADRVNAQQIMTFEGFLAVCYDTIEQAEARLLANNAELDVVNSDIAHQENARDTAEVDRDTAQEDLDEETARWDASVASYEAYMAELQSELAALDQVIELFASADVSDDMMARIDW